MRRVREILRLKHACGASDRAIGRSLGVARSTIALTLQRVAAAGLAWPLPETLSDRVLEAMLYADAGTKQGLRRKAEPDWTHVHRELRRPGVTLMLLWDEYRAGEPGGYAYSRWCELYRGWEGRLSPTMRQSHPAGERLFVDYAGQTVEIVDGRTGEVRDAQIFVAALGASSYTYAEATWSQSLSDWIGAHTRALAFLGGVPAQLVPDNPKVGVDRANWYEPGLNRTYLDMAAHYGTAILPTRVRKPRDKAKVEVAVLVVERWILARLRNRRFFSLAELNEAIAGLVADLNARPMRRLGVSRRDLFLELDRPVLKPLPAEPTSTPSGGRDGSGSTTMSTSTATTIRCRTASSVTRSTPGSRRAPSSCSGKASGSRCTCVGSAAAGTLRCPSTCRVRTDAMRSGRSSGSNERRRRSARTPPS